MHELDADSLLLVSKDCLSICKDQDEFSEPLGPLIEKYRLLGRRLRELSLMIQASERPYQHYDDQELTKHIHEAKTDLDSRHRSHSTRAWLKLPWNNASRDEKIAKLKQQADEHLRVAQEFRTGFLLHISRMRLDALVARLVQAGVVDSQSSAINDTIEPQSHHLSSSTVETIDQSAPAPVQPGKDERNYLTDDFSGVLDLARVIWKVRAMQANQSRHKRKQSVGKDLAKREFVDNVVDLIEETRLHTADIELLDGNPRKVLEKLIDIVSKAVRLNDTVDPPVSEPLVGSTTISDIVPNTVLSLEYLGEDLATSSSNPALMPDPQSRGRVQLPDTIEKGIRWDWPPGCEELLGMKSSEVQNDEKSVKSLDHQSENFDSKTETSPGPVVVSHSSESGLPTTKLIEELKIGTDSNASVQSLHQKRFKDGVKVFFPEMMSQPASCSLEINEFMNEVLIETAIVPRNGHGGVFRDQTVLENHGTTSESSNGSSQGSSSSAYTTSFTHLLRGSPRSIPSVKHPRYEGPNFDLERPYVITFHEAQHLEQEGLQKESQLLSHVEYIFSQRKHRDEVLSLLFGKTLQASAGVSKINFDTIVCLREAVNLWYDDGAGCFTITFLQGVRDQRTQALQAVEYEIIGTEHRRQVAENDSLIVLYVLSPQSRTRKRLRCSVHFSDPSGRKHFMDILRPP